MNHQLVMVGQLTSNSCRGSTHLCSIITLSSGAFSSQPLLAHCKLIPHRASIASTCRLPARSLKGPRNPVTGPTEVSAKNHT
jgi:hypothetical protein